MVKAKKGVFLLSLRIVDHRVSTAPHVGVACRHPPKLY